MRRVSSQCRLFPKLSCVNRSAPWHLARNTIAVDKLSSARLQPGPSFTACLSSFLTSQPLNCSIFTTFQITSLYAIRPNFSLTFRLKLRSRDVQTVEIQVHRWQGLASPWACDVSLLLSSALVSCSIASSGSNLRNKISVLTGL